MWRNEKNINPLLLSFSFAENFGKGEVKVRRVAGERSDTWIIESGPPETRQGFIFITRVRRREKQLAHGIPPGRGMMFSKDNEQLESFIGSGTEFQGGLNVKGTLRVEGQFDGKMNAACVILGETGVIKGEVSAKKIIIGGKVEGNLRVQEIVEIKATGKVFGDIFAKKISITEGAKVNGKIEMEVDENRVIEFGSKGYKG